MSMKKKDSISIEELKQEVIKSERAFAKSMADRELEAFAYWLSDEAIFFGTDPPLRGKESIVEYWSQFYTASEAPFSWDPDTVEVLASGTLALSSGSVRNPEGKITGLFNSIWRQESPGQWKVVFDKGSPVPSSRTE